jgi:hypothetical protein
VALAAVGAGLFAGSAAAKWVLELEPRPAGLRAGDPWHLQIRVVGTHFPRLRGVPVVRIRRAAGDRSYVQRTQAIPRQPRTYETTITFPEAGRWRYAVRHLRAVFRYRPVVIGERRPSERSSDGQSASLQAESGSDGPGPMPLVAGLGAASLLFMTAFAWRRRARRSPTAGTRGRLSV